MARLAIIHGTGAGRTVGPTPDGIVVGRQPGMDLTLDDGAVSRRHARFTWSESQVYVEDLGSSNGTYINEQRIHGRTEIGPDDLVRIGSHKFRLLSRPVLDDKLTIRQLTPADLSNPDVFAGATDVRLKTILHLAHALGSSTSFDSLLQCLVNQLLVLFGEADRATILFRENDEASVRATAVRESATTIPTGFSRSVLDHVFNQGTTVIASSDPDDGAWIQYKSLRALGIQSVLCIPLRIQNGPVNGALQVDRFRPGISFGTSDLYLATAVALMVAPILENARLQQELAERDRLRRELEMAREIQLGHLPQAPIHIAENPIELFADLIPALEVSGDFYDYFPIDPGRIAMIVADVDGKGLSAALYMAMAHALTRHIAKSTHCPTEVLAQLNEAMVRDNPHCRLISMVFAAYHASTGCLTIAHGGHPPALVRRHDGNVEVLKIRGAPLLGFDTGARRSEELSVMLSPGDALLLYTDGLTESSNAARSEMYGTTRLARLVETLDPREPLDAWASRIRSDVRRFSDSEAAEDDTTLLILRRPHSTSSDS